MLILIFTIPFGMYADRINPNTLTVTIFNQASNYNHSDINYIHLGSDSYIYLGLWKQSLLRVNGDGYKYYMKNKGGRSTFTVSSIYEDSGGQMWVGMMSVFKSSIR